MKGIKAFLKRILPPSVKSFMREITGLRQLMTQLIEGVSNRQHRQEELIAALTEQQRRQEHSIAALSVQQAHQAELMAEWHTELLKLQQRQSEKIEKGFGETAVRQKKEISGLAQKLEHIAADQQAVMDRLAVLGKLDTLQAELEQTNQVISAGQAGIEAGLEKAGEAQKKLSDGIERVRKQSIESSRYASEAVWAEIFNNAVSGSAWLKNKAFAPGRWAVGYPYLYVMYRVLNEARPKRILELGLGQSTRMIAQYAAAHEDVEHIVVEHDPEWINFFQNDFQLSPQSQIIQLDREMVPYKEAEAVRVFKGFQEKFSGEKFDFISIDAPLGGDMKQYARIDVLGLLPECLSEDFVIMIDDCERSGETHTVAEMESRLKECDVPYKRGKYSGKKDCILISAERMGFLTSM